jgi:hypothetical protein
MSKKPNSDFLSGLRVVKEENAVTRPNELSLPSAVAPIFEGSRPAPTAVARQKGREGKVSITQWVDPIVRKQIAQISLDEDKDQYVLINEALNLLFEKYGRSPIA